MIPRSILAAVNHHRGRYTSPALAAASYPFVDLPSENVLRCKPFPADKLIIYSGFFLLKCSRTLYNEGKSLRSGLVLTEVIEEN